MSAVVAARSIAAGQAADFDAGVAEVFEHLFQHLRDQKLVFHDQDARTGTDGPCRPVKSRSSILLQYRKRHIEGTTQSCGPELDPHIAVRAMPVSAGMAAKNALNAVRPPAEAPMPTIRGASLGCAAVGTAGPSAGLRRRRVSRVGSSPACCQASAIQSLRFFASNQARHRSKVPGRLPSDGRRIVHSIKLPAQSNSKVRERGEPTVRSRYRTPP